MVIYSYERDEIALRNNRRTDDDPQLVFVVPFRLIEGGIDPFDGYSTVVVDIMRRSRWANQSSLSFGYCQNPNYCVVWG
jgi:hypothetical protein